MSNSNPAIVARLIGTSKRYRDTIALRDVSLDIHAGGVVAILGPNGAGKTTTVKLLLGLTAPSSGTVLLFGTDPRRLSSRQRVGAMLQVAKVPETLRVREHIDLFQSYYPNPLPVTEVIEVGGLVGLENKKFGELSGGQRQRVLFALALAGDPEVLFLDEPTLGFDVEVRRAFWQQIRGLVSRGRTVVLTTHYLEEADALADRVVVIDRGRVIADGTSSEIKTRVTGKRIRCRTRLPEPELRAIDGVTAVKIDGERKEIFTSAAEPVVRELLTRDSLLSDLEVLSLGLEDAFLSLIQSGEAA
ncbi:MAG TPA: ABC transporter ATP-binding protein [Gemmatimonadaceae bacterium]|jgi:ABC-2 type transport system ATP-binding protein|nr:ABC transporter ATP-binding protein [Gemmatimonadaceae bacterium]